MRTKWKIGFAVAIALSLFVAQAAVASEQGGKIVGTVVDEAGAPVTNAEVTPKFAGFGVMHTLVNSAATDKFGKFIIEGLAFGPYAVYVGKESDGYPNTVFTAYRIGKIDRVVLSPAHPIAKVRLHIGPKGGLFAASVRDAVTHEPRRCSVKVRLVQKPENWTSFSEPGDFKLLLPANTAVFVEIEKQGYETWKMPRTVRAKSGELTTVQAELRSTKGQ